MAVVTIQTIDGNATFSKDYGGDDVVVDGKIDGNSRVNITARAVTIRDKIDGQSEVRIKLHDGNFTLQGRIDGASKLWVQGAAGITIQDKVDGRAILFLQSETTIVIRGKLDGKAEIHYWAPDIQVNDKIDGGAFHVKENWGKFPDLT